MNTFNYPAGVHINFVMFSKISKNHNLLNLNPSGEVTPASTFMSGKVKVMGDLSKALKLEEILRAAREADERKAAKNG